MLTEDCKQEIRDKLAAIGKEMPGFRSRPAQRLMIAEVAKTLARCPDPGPNAGQPPAGSTVVIAQGSTGTGKSLAYSLAGLIMSRRKGKKLVISSSTIALQEQLSSRDLPLFIKAAGLTAKVELAKGRTRYICAYKAAQILGDMQQLGMFAREERAGGELDLESVRQDIESMAADFAAGRWNGDRDTRPHISDDVWKSLTMDRHGCLSRSCPSYRYCAQMQARKRIKEAQVVVVNHDLLLADLAMGGGKILPAPAETFYVIDESHSLPEKAVASFASSHFVHADKRSAEKLANLTAALGEALGSAYAPTVDRLREEARALRTELGDVQRFFDGLVQLQPSREVPRPTLEFDQACLPEEFFTLGGNIIGLTGSLAKLVDESIEGLNTLLNSDRSKHALYEKLLADLGFYKGRLEEVHATWGLFLEEPKDESAAPVAKWIESVKLKGSLDYQLNASPVVAAGYLRRHFWEKAAGVVLTSATITTMGNFDDFLRRTGLDAYQVPCIDLPSPFDYAQQGVLTIPRMPSPKNYEAHTAALTARLLEDFAQQGAEGMLVLFTSRKQMEDVFSRIPAELQSRILMQGGQSKAAMIEAHRQRVLSGAPSVLFGLESFIEGVDLAGELCTKVVITKLPFAVPDSPVLRTLSAWITRRGGNAFMEISVPAAARKLEQGIGRLIRTETDRGEVVVTDPRLWESRFGRAILRGLPPFRLIAMGNEVRP